MPVSLDQLDAPPPTASSAAIKGPAGKGISIDSLAPITAVSGSENKSEWDKWMAFGKKAGSAVLEQQKTAAEHPIKNAIGVGKGIASGAVQLADLAAQGITGLASAALGKGFDKGKDNATNFVEKARELTTHITGMNLETHGDEEKAFGKL